MPVIADHPSAKELDSLADLLNACPLDRKALAETLHRIEHGLRDWAAELDRSGGLLEESDKAARPSLAREDDRLRDEVHELIHEVQLCGRESDGPGGDDELRYCAAAILAGLRGHRDAEASLVLENADTEVGAGD